MPDQTTPNLSVQGHLSTSTLLAFEEAKKMGITYQEIPGTLIIKMEYKGVTRYYKPQLPFQTSYTGYYIAAHKHIGKQFLTQSGISVPQGITLTNKNTREEFVTAFSQLNKPLVVKPTNGTQGQDVFMDITTEEAFLHAIDACQKFSTEEDAAVIIEEQFQGKEFRILATPEKVIGIIYRIPANVIGDSQHTIAELIEMKNDDPRRHENPEAALVTIKVDEHVKTYMAQNNISLSDIPPKGVRVFLRPNSNISTGGDSIDYTDLAHPSVKEIAIRVMNAIPGLAIGGIDFMTPDITQPQTPSSYLVLEVNSSPGYSIHDMPYEGINRKATREFLYILFPEARKDLESA